MADEKTSKPKINVGEKDERAPEPSPAAPSPDPPPMRGATP